MTTASLGPLVSRLELEDAVVHGRTLDLALRRVSAVSINEVVSDPRWRGTSFDQKGRPLRLSIFRTEVVGRLDLSDIESKLDIEIQNSIFTDGVTIARAKLGRIDLSNSEIRSQSRRGLDSGVALDATKLRAVDLTLNQTQLFGSLNIDDARFSGSVRLQFGTRITLSRNASYVALSGERMLVEGGFIASELECSGSVVLTRATIGDTLNLDWANLGDPVVSKIHQVAFAGLDVRNIAVGGRLSLFSCKSQYYINMLGAKVADDVILTDLSILGTGPGSEHNPDGYSLCADLVNIGSHAVLNGLRLVGGILLRGARIAGDFELSRGSRIGTTASGTSLDAEDSEITGQVYLGVAAEATINLSYVVVGGVVVMYGSVLAGPISVRAIDLHAKGLHCNDTTRTPTGRSVVPMRCLGVFDLTRSKIAGDLDISMRSFESGSSRLSPGLPRLILDQVETRTLSLVLDGVGSVAGGTKLVSAEGLVFSNRPDPASATVDQWLRLLRSHADYQPKAYQQLALVYRQAGHERDAGRILMAQQDHRRKSELKPNLASRFGLGVLKVTVGYGHRPGRAGALLTLLIVAALLMVVIGDATNDGTSGQPVIRSTHAAGAQAVVDHCSTGELVSLALRVAVPLVANLGQGSCAINTSSTTGGTVALIAWSIQVVAWVLGALVVAGVGRAIRKI